MSAIASVIYPNQPDGKFDMDYYLQTHMPLVMKHWGPMGLKEYKIHQFDKGLNGADCPYRVQAVLYWDSAESIQAATAHEVAQIVFGDVPKFTNIGPMFTAGGVVGSG